MANIWPRAYLLDIYNKAIESGFLWVKVEHAEQARSLTQSLYRLRRRSDKANARFILPEFHLVTCGEFVPDRGLPVVYSRLPDGQQLPAVEPGEGGMDLQLFQPAPTAEQILSPPALPSQDDLLNLAGEKIQDFDVDSYVSRMQAKVKKGQQE